MTHFDTHLWAPACRCWRALPDLAPAPGGATGEFVPQNLVKPPPRLRDCCSRVEPETLGRSNGQNGMVTCLRASYLLLVGWI